MKTAETELAEQMATAQKTDKEPETEESIFNSINEHLGLQYTKRNYDSFISLYNLVV
jgi:hypothetical protein